MRLGRGPAADGSGDLWSYLAGLGPLLDPGVNGGSTIQHGTNWTWSYHAGKVFFNGQERPEDGLADHRISCAILSHPSRC